MISGKSGVQTSAGWLQKPCLNPDTGLSQYQLLEVSAEFDNLAVVGDLDKGEFCGGLRVEARMQGLADEWKVRKQRLSIYRWPLREISL